MKKLKWIIGPCVVESKEIVEEVAKLVVSLQASFPDHEFVFKASFDKANRTKVDAFRSIGMDTALEILSEIKEKYGLQITTDIHESWQAEEVARYVDEIQIPAFLCRQTDLLFAAAKTNKIVNIKKAQWLKGDEMQDVINKIEYLGNKNIQLIERGSYHGYKNIVVDFLNMLEMKALGYPVIFDATHSTPPEYSFDMIKAAVALGVDGIFMEVHPDPERALSDGSRSVKLNKEKIHEIVQMADNIRKLL